MFRFRALLLNNLNPCLLTEEFSDKMDRISRKNICINKIMKIILLYLDSKTRYDWVDGN